MELCISVDCRFCHRAQLLLIMLQKSQQVWVCRSQAFDMKCRGALERRSGNIDLQELLIYRNKKHYRHIFYSGGIHPQMLLSTHVSDFSALRECTSYLSTSTNITAQPSRLSVFLGDPSALLSFSACASLCHCFISWQLPFLSHPPIHHTPLIYSCFVFTHSFGLPLSFTVPPQEWWHRKGQLTDLRTPESPVSRGLDLICINLHNFIKAQGDAVHTVAWDTSERNSPLRMAVIMGLSLLTTVGDWNSEKFHVDRNCSAGDWRFRSDDLRNAFILNVQRTTSVAVKVRCEVLQSAFKHLVVD